MCENDVADDPDGSDEDGSADDDPYDVSLSLDAILSLLADHRRRDLLRFLVEAPDETATVEECIGHLIEREAERAGERPSHAGIETTLYHVHLPKLADAGVIEYDPRSQEIRYRGEDRLETWLERIVAAETEPD